MSFIQNLFTSRDNNANTETYVGQQGRIWWNPDTNAFYVNTANVPGGTPVTLPATANLVINTITANSGNITGNLIVSGNISPASNVKIGGVRAGPGANISNDGLLTIDTAGLPFSFGDFTANANLLTLVNVDQNMVLATQGNAEVQLVGNIGFYRTNGFPPNVANRYFSASDIGQITIQVTATDGMGAVEIIGSQSGNTILPGISGAMLHITGQLDTPCRLYYDGNSDYVSMVARRWNGNVDVPTQVLANEDVLRINSTAATNAGVGNVGMAQIRTTALENQTTTAQGSSITFTVTPIGSPANARVDVANITVANGITATKFTTAGTVIATGNITGGNVLTAGVISSTGNITGGNIAAMNYTGLVTHSIRNAGVVSGTTLTLNVTTDDIVKCTFADNFTIAFSNIIAGRVVTLIATNTSAGDTDIITAGISSVNMQGDSTLTVTQQTTAIITYYSLDGDTANIYASAVFA